MPNGGELYAVFQLTSKSSQDQHNVAASLQAQLHRLAVGRSVESTVQHLKKTSPQVSAMSVLFYQRARRDISISLATQPEEITKRLKEFPTSANAASVDYLAQIIDHQVLACPRSTSLASGSVLRR